MTSTIGRKHISYSLISVTTKEERLLAAAPDLLEALKEVRHYIPKHGSTRDIFAMIDAAIAKAEGKE